MKKLKILFVSDSGPEKINNTKNIEEAFKRISSIAVETEYFLLSKTKNNFFFKLFYKLRLPLDPDNLNKRILNKTRHIKPDILFICKGNSIYPSTLKKIKTLYKCRIISWSNDDMYNPINRSFYYTYGLKFYDLIVTQKSYNVDELRAIGAKKILFQNKAFCKKNHRPTLINPKIREMSDVLFIGSAENERFEYMQYLAKKGIKIVVYGYGWQKKQYNRHHKNLEIMNIELKGNEYCEAITSSKISLCFLRKLNRDLQTDRTMEIPACKGFMLAERTKEHLKLFQEGKEVEYFETKEELLKKIQYYLSHENERKKIVNAGYKRVIKDNHTYDNRVSEILRVINES